MNTSSSTSPSPPRPPSSSPISILAPVGVTLLLFLVFFVAYYFAHRQQRVGSRFHEAAAAGHEEMDEDDDDYVGVKEEIVKSFPRFVYSRRREFVRGGGGVGKEEEEMEMEEGGSRCSICLLEYKGSDTITMLPVCDHFFHQGCVDQWMKLHSTCPICRISLLRSTRRFRLN
ncbi:hypothetical protein MLD38_019033 [Melastoma candidum]|uniref:Uncharacterized protein n=1 Tax=Melastoma candidum TaxID=119954 RepID=A0ACB9QZQ6_9MYRT|nr:hypothetical protein MLD38_019033 [Melastoma candidum]